MGIFYINDNSATKVKKAYPTLGFTIQPIHLQQQWQELLPALPENTFKNQKQQFMTTAYFLTGSLNDQDNDFELQITAPSEELPVESGMYTMLLTDISSETKSLWQTQQPTFKECLDALDEFLSENFITLYSKILTSGLRDTELDKELEGFILNRLELLE